jgi:hypothetical protein
MTLIELVLVMGLMALMLGFGVGAIASIDVGTYGSGSLVRSTLRSAGNWSRARHAPARVRIDRAAGRMTAEGLAVVGTWHFESQPPEGAFGLDGSLAGARLVEDGFVGRALGLRGTERGARYEAPVHTDPAFALTEGFRIEVALRPEGTRRGNLLELGGTLKLEASNRLGLALTLVTQRFDETTGEVRTAGRAIAQTPEGVLEPDAWNRVLLVYDRAHLEIWVEGLRVASVEEEGAVEKVRGPLVVGGGDRPWEGSVDSLVVSAVGAEEELSLPEGVRFAEDAPKVGVFDAGGGLDRAVHASPARIVLEYDDGRTDEVRVNLYGTVE